MFKPVREDQQRGRPRRRKRRLRRIQMLPTLLTLGNLYFGFAAVYCCALEMRQLGAGEQASAKVTLNSQFFEARAPSYLSVAVWLVIAAALCDALDGRVARRTGASSRFGEELDSLADVVSFGVAPGLMMITLVQRELTYGGVVTFGFNRFGQAAVLIGTLYACFTGLRLARFNVEASAEEATHEGFRGLPSPGAAAAIVGTVFLQDRLVDGEMAYVAHALTTGLPLATLVLALLMVSRVPYRHFVSSLLRRRPFEHVIVLLLVLPLVWIYTEHAFALVAWCFVVSGPLGVSLRRVGLVSARMEAPEAPGETDEVRSVETKRHA